MDSDMIDTPVIETARLQLRTPVQSDIQAIQTAAAAREIADTMISLPHPYPEGEAERYLARQRIEQEAGHSYTFIIELIKDGGLCGVIELRDIDREHSQGELSFWLAVEVWGKGYMSEALQAMVRYGLEVLKLNRLYAYHMLRNPATGRILEKNAFRQEGVLFQRVRKWGHFEDVALWAILRQDWQSSLAP